MKMYHVYILASRKNGTLYVGVTGNLYKRTVQHKTKFYPGSFSARYKVDRLVYYEEFLTAREAILREKQLKAGSRKKKIALIVSMNPEWNDLFDSVPVR